MFVCVFRVVLTITNIHIAKIYRWSVVLLSLLFLVENVFCCCVVSHCCYVVVAVACCPLVCYFYVHQFCEHHVTDFFPFFFPNNTDRVFSFPFRANFYFFASLLCLSTSKNTLCVCVCVKNTSLHLLHLHVYIYICVCIIHCICIYNIYLMCVVFAKMFRNRLKFRSCSFFIRYFNSFLNIIDLFLKKVDSQLPIDNFFYQPKLFPVNDKLRRIFPVARKRNKEGHEKGISKKKAKV